jgi:hypothetical protein
MSAKWWVQQEGEIAGSYDALELVEHYRAGLLSPRAMVSQEGTETWLFARDAFGRAAAERPAPPCHRTMALRHAPPIA